MRILVLNCGSSSIKYRLFDGEEPVATGIVERIGQQGIGSSMEARSSSSPL